jgi:hypothetical protein
MLKGHPQLAEYQAPVLLAVARNRTFFAPELSERRMYKSVAEDWDRFVDSSFVRPGSFKVVFQRVVGTLNEGRKQLEGGASSLLPSVGQTMEKTEKKSKRMASDVLVVPPLVGEKSEKKSKRGAAEVTDEAEEENVHRNKRPRQATVTSEDDAWLRGLL